MQLLPDRTTQLIQDLTSVGLPEVPVLGVHLLQRARPGLTMHRHPNRFEICYLAKGERIFHVNGRDYPMKGNDVFWTSAEEPHGSGNHADGKGVQYWIHLVLPKTPRGFLALSARDAWPLVCALRRLPVRCFQGSLEMKDRFEQAFLIARSLPGTYCQSIRGQKLHRSPETSALSLPPPEQRLLLASQLVEFLCAVIACAKRNGAPAYSLPIQAAMKVLELETPESLAAWALKAGLSESHFKALFRTEVGVPPGEYLLRRRLDRAQELLRTTGKSVTDIAHELGFSSSQYFATAFQRFTNSTPSAYRAGLKS